MVIHLISKQLLRTSTLSRLEGKLERTVTRCIGTGFSPHLLNPVGSLIGSVKESLQQERLLVAHRPLKRKLPGAAVEAGPRIVALGRSPSEANALSSLWYESTSSAENGGGASPSFDGGVEAVGF